MTDPMLPQSAEERPESNPKVRLTGLTPQRVLAGGMSLVYLCASALHGDDGVVAVKRLRATEFGGSTEGSVRFLRECFLWLQLGKHPNIVTAISAHQAPHEPPMLVLEFVPESLRQTLRAGRFDTARTVRLAWDVTHALGYARSQLPGFVHADLKPENILLAGSTAKVTDLGLSRAVHDRSPNGGEDAGAGTPLYMAPEQVRGVAVPASDIYSLGCVLFEALTGVPPHGPPERGVDYRLRHLYGTPMPLITLRPDVPVEFADLIHACLAKLPEDRPDLARIVDLLHALAPTLTEPHAPGPDASVIREAMRGMVNLGFADDAIDAYTRALLRLPNLDTDRDIRYLVARALNERRRWSEAEEHLQWLTENASDEDRHWRGVVIGERGRAAQLAGRTADARHLFGQAVRLVPESSVGWSNFAMALEQEGMIEEAIVALQMAILRSLNLVYLVAITKWLIGAGRPREAMCYARLAKKTHPSEMLAHGAVFLAAEEIEARPDGDLPAPPSEILGEDGKVLLDRLGPAFEYLFSDEFQG